MSKAKTTGITLAGIAAVIGSITGLLAVLDGWAADAIAVGLFLGVVFVWACNRKRIARRLFGEPVDKNQDLDDV